MKGLHQMVDYAEDKIESHTYRPDRAIYDLRYDVLLGLYWYEEELLHIN